MPEFTVNTYTYNVAASDDALMERDFPRMLAAFAYVLRKNPSQKITTDKNVACTMFVYNNQFSLPLATSSIRKEDNGKSGHSERLSLTNAIKWAINNEWGPFVDQQGKSILKTLASKIDFSKSLSLEEINECPPLKEALRQTSIFTFTELAPCDFPSNALDAGCTPYFKTLQSILNNDITVCHHFAKYTPTKTLTAYRTYEKEDTAPFMLEQLLKNTNILAKLTKISQQATLIYSQQSSTPLVNINTTQISSTIATTKPADSNIKEKERVKTPVNIGEENQVEFPDQPHDMDGSFIHALDEQEEAEQTLQEREEKDEERSPARLAAREKEVKETSLEKEEADAAERIAKSRQEGDQKRKKDAAAGKQHPEIQNIKETSSLSGLTPPTSTNSVSSQKESTNTNLKRGRSHPPGEQ